MYVIDSSVSGTGPISEFDVAAIKLDHEGFLIDRYDWDKKVAQQLAGSEGISVLTEQHWQVLLFLRDYYNRFSSVPPPRIVCRRLGMEGHNIKKLFGSCLAVWRVAGLPCPGDEVKAHMHM